MMVAFGESSLWLEVESENDVQLIDTSTAYDLSVSQTVFLNLEQGTTAIFSFEMTQYQSKIQFKVWERGLR